MSVLGIPYSFTNGTVADAIQVNANFNAVKSFVEGSVVQADGSVQAPTAAIADGAVTSAKIADGTIVTGDISDGAITSAKIADGAIQTGDIADSAITSAKIADGTITTADIADGAITSAKIFDGTITNDDINASAGIVFSKLSGRNDWQTFSPSYNAGAGVDGSRTTWRYKIIDKVCFIKGYVYATSTASNVMLNTITGLPAVPKDWTYYNFLAGMALQQLSGTSSFVHYPVLVSKNNNCLNIIYTTVSFAQSICHWSFDIVYEIE